MGANLSFSYAPSCLNGASSRLAVVELALPCSVFGVTRPVFQHIEVALTSPQQGNLLTQTQISRLE